MRRIIQDAINSSGSLPKSGELRYGAALKWIGWICLGFCLAMVTVAGVAAAKEQKMIVIACFGAFSLLGAVLLAEAYWVRISYDEQCIRTRSPWRRSRRIAWSEVVSCDYSMHNQWYRIHTRSQGIVRVSLLLRGVPGLLQMLPCEHPSYPPVAASGRAIYGHGQPQVLLPGKPVVVNPKAAHAFCWIFAAMGLGMLVLHFQCEPPRLEDYREVRGTVTDIQTKPGNRGSQIWRLTVVPGTPAVLAFLVPKKHVEPLKRVLRVGSPITALVSREEWANPRKPLFVPQPQIWMAGLQGPGWQFLRFEDHVAHEEREITILFWGGIGFILFGLGLRWQINRETRKQNQASLENTHSGS